jgi:hypothetical protein
VFYVCAGLSVFGGFLLQLVCIKTKPTKDIGGGSRNDDRLLSAGVLSESQYE